MLRRYYLRGIFYFMKKFIKPEDYWELCEWCPDVKGYCSYIILCVNGKLYKGYTSNLKIRMMQHWNNSGSLFTRTWRPVSLLHYEVFIDRKSACARESFYKKNYQWIIENMGKFNLCQPPESLPIEDDSDYQPVSFEQLVSDFGSVLDLRSVLIK